jgi:hypothetical protein
MLARIQNSRNNISAKITDIVLSFTDIAGPIHLLKGHHLIAKLNYTQRHIAPSALPTAALLIAYKSPRHQNNAWIRDLTEEGIEPHPGPQRPQRNIPPPSLNLNQMFANQRLSNDDRLRALQTTLFEGPLPDNAALTAA